MANMLSALGPWAILPDRLDPILEVIQTHSIQVNREPSPEHATTIDLDIRDGIAVIPIHGVLMKDPGFFNVLFGATAMRKIGQSIVVAIADSRVKAIVLDVDSPGGTVDGTVELARIVFSSKAEKPIVAFANGIMASAAYWIGSAADYVITEPTGEVGSIGVLQAHYDYSKADEKAGLKRTYIHAGKYKTAGNNAEPLNEDSREYLQAGVDYIYSLFVNAVARHRGVSITQALAMADGQIFIGEQAVEAELVDEIGRLEDAIQKGAYLADRFRMFGSRIERS